MPEIASIALAITGGFFPSLAWLWFWLREDSEHPEPRRLIALAFFAGMLTVAVVVPIEEGVQPYLTTTVLLFSVWSAIEEICKYGAARLTVLWRRDDDEPIDPVMYMVTVALGFAAVENALFLFSPLSGGTVLSTIQTGDLRFVGATLVHVLSSAIVGMALSFTFYRSKMARRLAVFIGVILASTLHATFNFFILNAGPQETLAVLTFVWAGVIILLAVLEWIKRIRVPKSTNPIS
ncbi:MAG TPA: PrsW family glutamic-type intramembrane protease [Candidatus Paceibacterota bacterium]|nr:PrsW family glutamic-type intramembrane protease [Candidatus Paceibacterota bacterium]